MHVSIFKLSCKATDIKPTTARLKHRLGHCPLCVVTSLSSSEAGGARGDGGGGGWGGGAPLGALTEKLRHMRSDCTLMVILRPSIRSHSTCVSPSQ